MSGAKTYSIDHPTLRGVLATQRIPKRSLAKACRLNENHVRRILNGDAVPGELAIRKLAEGLQRLGLGGLAATALPNLDCLNGATPKGAGHAE